MTDKQRAYFESILARIAKVTDEEKAIFTEKVEADKNCKSFCISYAKELDRQFGEGRKKAIKHADALIDFDPVTGFVARFIKENCQK